MEDPADILNSWFGFGFLGAGWGVTPNGLSRLDVDSERLEEFLGSYDGLRKYERKKGTALKNYENAKNALVSFQRVNFAKLRSKDVEITAFQNSLSKKLAKWRREYIDAVIREKGAEAIEWRKRGTPGLVDNPSMPDWDNHKSFSCFNREQNRWGSVYSINPPDLTEHSELDENERKTDRVR